jgi:hypothetical protein
MNNLDTLMTAAEIKATSVREKIALIWASTLVWLLVPYYLIKGGSSWKER